MRHLLSVSIGEFAGAYADVPLTYAAGLGEQLAKVLTDDRQGYRHVAVTGEPTAATIGDLVRRTLRDAIQAGPDEIVIVHVLSHGDDHLDDVRVVGADGISDQDTSVDGWLRRASVDGRSETATLPTGSAGPWVLFLIDLCGAGRAVRQPWQAGIADERRRVWAIAATGHDQRAYNGWFTQATVSVLGDLRLLDVGPELPHVPIDAVARAIRHKVNQLAGDDSAYQRVVASRVDITTDAIPTPFFANPLHRAGLAQAIPVHLRPFVAQLDDLADPWHFITRAAGHTPDQDLHAGYFHGRGAQLRALSEWLLHPRPADTLRVITGSPGVGKSALLGMLVCSAHPDLAEATRGLWQPRKADLPPATLRQLVVVHARDTDLADVLDAIARQVRHSAVQQPDAEADASSQSRTIDDLTTLLRGLSRPPVIVIDAVDESHQPPQLVELITRLADAPTRSDGRTLCRLLVGTRSGPEWHLLDALVRRPDHQVIDLDQTEPIELRADLAAYADDLLRAHPHYGDHQYLAARSTISQTVAERLTTTDSSPASDQPRWGPFLVAGLFVRGLTRQPPIADSHLAATVAAAVPRTLPAVLELDLQHLDVRWARPVLTALAHSFGAGMPRSHLSAAATVFAPPGLPAPSEHDIGAALTAIRFYLRRELGPDGINVYRPFHQSISEHLRADPLATAGLISTAEVHAAVLERLLFDIRSANRDQRDWAHLATAYLRRHVIDHASATGRIDEFLTDTEFLVHADPTTLANHLGEAVEPNAQRAAAVYRTTVAARTNLDASDFRSLLALDAARHGDQRLAQHLSCPPHQAQPLLLPRWGTLTQDSPNLRHTLTGHTGPVVAVATLVLPDGTPIAVTGSQDRTARVWDLIRGRPRLTLTGHADRVVAVATVLLPDGTPVAVTASGDRGARVWDLTDGEARHTLTGHTGAVTAVATLILPDGTPAAVTASDDGSAQVWDITCGEPRHTLTGHTGPVEAVTTLVLPDGTPVAVTASRDHTARVWDLTRGTMRHTLIGHTGPVKAVAAMVLPDGTPVAVTASRDHMARVWDLIHGRRRRTLTGHTGPVEAVATLVLADGTPVAVTVSWDHTVRVWDLTRGRTRHSLTGHARSVMAVATLILPEGTPVAVTASADGSARVWDLSRGRRRHILTGHTRSVGAVATLTLPEGIPVAVTASRDDSVRVWDLTPGVIRHTLTGHTGRVEAMAMVMLPDGTTLAVTSGRDGSARVWDLTHGEVRHTLTGQTSPVMAMATVVLPDGTAFAVTGARDGRARVLDLTRGEVRHTLTGHSGPVDAVTTLVLPDGTPVALTASRDRRARVWDLTHGRSRHTLTGHTGAVKALTTQLLPDGATVAVTASADGSARVWDLTRRKGRLRHTLTGHAGPVTAVTALALPDGAAVAVTAGHDHTARVWDLSRGRRRHTLTGHTGPVTAITTLMLPDGSPVAVTASRDHTARVWDLAHGKLLHTLTGHAGPVRAVAAMTLPIGRPIAITTGDDAAARVWDLVTGLGLQRQPLPYPPGPLAAIGDLVLLGFGWEVVCFGPPPKGELGT